MILTISTPGIATTDDMKAQNAIETLAQFSAINAAIQNIIIIHYITYTLYHLHIILYYIISL